MELEVFVQSLYADFQKQLRSDISLIRSNPEDRFENWAKQRCESLEAPHRQRIMDEIFAWGPLQPLLERDDIFDILIQGKSQIWIDTPEGIEKWPDQFLSDQSFRNFCERLLSESKQILDQKKPYVDGSLGNFRLHMTAPPLSPQIQITLRRHRNTQLDLNDLLQSGFLTELQLQLVRKLIDEKKNFLVAGPTGSGKTTFLRSILQSLAQNERVVILEDTHELEAPNSSSARLVSRNSCPETLNEITLTDLIRQSLRMRPDRIVVGEVRGPEAKDLLLALATGHSGSLGTLHAQSAGQALLRLEMLVQMGAPQWSLESIRRLIQMSLDYIIVLREDRGQKGIAEISRIASLESFGLTLENQSFIQESFKPYSQRKSL